MDSKLTLTLSELKSKGWTVRLREANLSLPAFVQQRYPWLPRDVESLFCETELVCDATAKLWFLSSADFRGESDAAYAWNEWELQSLEAADSDSDWTSSIRGFWDEHLPVALSTVDGSSYYAVRRDGSIVYGREPEFEEPEVYASSLTEFLECLATD
jgi:hypothetical protein